MDLTHFKYLYILLFLFISCSYDVVKEVDSSGKTYKFRYYKNYERNKAYRNKLVFKYRYSQQHYQPYQGVFKQTILDYGLMFQYDSAAILLGRDAATIVPIFTSNLLYPRLIYCAADSNCSIQTGPIATDLITGEVNKWCVGDYCGRPIISIPVVEELKYLEKTPKKRRFKLHVTFGGEGYLMYFIELTNENATKHLSLNDFVKGAKLTFLEYGWGEI